MTSSVEEIQVTFKIDRVEETQVTFKVLRIASKQMTKNLLSQLSVLKCFNLINDEIVIDKTIVNGLTVLGYIALDVNTTDVQDLYIIFKYQDGLYKFKSETYKMDIIIKKTMNQLFIGV